MNLKEAFRFQNKITSVIDTAAGYLGQQENVMKITVEHLRKKANPDAENEVVELTDSRPFPFEVNQLVSFLVAMIDEKEKLYKAITAAKKNLDYDMDAQIDLNMRRQSTSRLFRDMSNIRSSEVIQRGRGMDYTFNAEKNQMQYYYDLKRVSVIDFDRKKVKNMANQLINKADEVSTKIDRIMVNTEVEYTPIFGVNDSFDEAVEAYLETV
ncbi:MAG: hypothetical protein EOM34_08675 [Clostridia bacterium]|nr:hypothetical protein [Lachnospiraceae bacterium]NCC00740.1 hypothetical protein [Clostridia bacterium]NCD03104.1 hypothetical protein [Clostridia bacterium]